MSGKSKMNRLRRMTEALKKAAEGDYSVRIETCDKQDDIDLLADAINKMVGQTHERIEKVERNEDATKFRYLHETMMDAFASCDMAGYIQEANSALQVLLGYSEDELRQMTFRDLTPEKWHAAEARIIEEEVMVRGYSGVYEKEYRKKDGTIFPVELRTFLVRDSAGRPIGSRAIVRDISERKRAEEALELFRFSIDRASDAVFWLDCDGSFPYVNEQVCRYLGYTREEMMCLHVWDIAPKLKRDRWPEQWEDVKRVGKSAFETVHRHKDGKFIPVEISANHIKFGDKEFHIAFVRDITERKQEEKERAKLEAQLIQAQKMESVGRLAGGVAHDFNNMLSVILGYAELIKSQLSIDDPLMNYALEIEKAAKRSRDTTRQLLAFSRKQIISPRPMNLNDLITATQTTLSRLIGENINLRFHPESEPCPIRFDPGQIDQILINLVVNARDAMPNGGRLTIETKNVQLNENYCRKHLGAVPGSYVMLAVSDDGTGMDKKTLSHVFEPFFTTKEVGKGTGLGLATVYGIVKQNGGLIYVYSEPGQGTTFKIYLPRSVKEDEFKEEAEEAPSVDHGSGTVLLVEDDDMVRRMTAAMLTAIGYTVLVAETPMNALSISEKGDVPIDLLITDVVMPEMSGPELRNKMLVSRPEIKVLFMSGYTSNVIVDHGMLEEGVHFIQKPFSKNDLASKIHDVIGDKSLNLA